MLRFRREGRSDPIPPQRGLSRVTCPETPVSREAQVAAELRREGESKKRKPEGAQVKAGREDSSREGEGCACALFFQLSPAALARGQVTAGPGLPRAAWGARSARPALARRAGRPSPSSRPSRRVPYPRVPPAGAEASRRQQGHFLTPDHCPGCPFLSDAGPAATPAPGCRM